MRALLLLAVGASAPCHAALYSPDGHLRVDVEVNSEGEPNYRISASGSPVLLSSRLGLERDDQDFSSHLKLNDTSPVSTVQDDYTLLTGKRRVNHYAANRQVFDFEAATGEHLHVVFQVSNDGVAFRYEFPRHSERIHHIRREASEFRFLPGTSAWLQPMSVAKSGYKEVNPAYEEIYQQDIPVGTPPVTNSGWALPALFRSGDTWLLVGEGSLPRNYCASRLESHWRDTRYSIAFPDPKEGLPGGPVAPESTLPWLTPWRFVVIGDLKTLMESNLGTDLAEKPAPGTTANEDLPGKASWSWPLLGSANTIYAVQKEFIDYAADMHWRYTLIDARWDRQIGYEKVQQLVDYAREKGVKILLWYNSAGSFNSTPQTPRDVLLTHASRIREFDRLKAMGAAGLKIDFFGGDGQSMIAYYRDILDDAAPYGFAMNFHGSTPPRGWQRTYPNLMTAEAVRGLEYVTFDQRNADDEPAHAAMLPFTRNLFDPMDFTPVVLDHIDHIERRTSSAFELALSVLFVSGIQHYAEIPAGMRRAPEFARAFLRQVPSTWDEVRFIDGFPGRYVVVARRGNGHWYVAGINADQTPISVNLTLPLTHATTATLISDGGTGESLGLREQRLTLTADHPETLTLQGRGGFVLAVD
jgi:alpha-glucosidase